MINKHMRNLITDLSTVLATITVLYYRTHAFHWNVQGKNFPQLHAMFGEQYNDLWESLDITAESLRTLGAMAPTSLQTIIELSAIKLEERVPSAEEMVAQLVSDHEMAINVLNAAFFSAEQVRNQAIMNHLAERLEHHQKFLWQLKSTMEQEPEENDELSTLLKNAGIIR